jgi:hypothetical protein
MAYLIITAEYFAVASPALLIIGGLCSLISDYRFKKSLK